MEKQIQFKSSKIKSIEIDIRKHQESICLLDKTCTTLQNQVFKLEAELEQETRERKLFASLRTTIKQSSHFGAVTEIYAEITPSLERLLGTYDVTSISELIKHSLSPVTIENNPIFASGRGSCNKSKYPRVNKLNLNCMELEDTAVLENSSVPLPYPSTTELEENVIISSTTLGGAESEDINVIHAEDVPNDKQIVIPTNDNLLCPDMSDLGQNDFVGNPRNLVGEISKCINAVESTRIKTNPLRIQFGKRS